MYNKLPYGNLPRLLLAWVCTEAVQNQNRVLVLGKSLAKFMRELGMLAIIGKRIFLDFRRPATGHANLVSGVGSAEMDRSSG